MSAKTLTLSFLTKAKSLRPRLQYLALRPRPRTNMTKTCSLSYVC